MIYHNHSNPNRPIDDCWWNLRLVKVNPREMKIMPVIYSNGKHQVINDQRFKVSPEMIVEAFENQPIEG